MTTQQVVFRVPGQAVPKQSFRKTARGGYRDPRVSAWQETVGWQARQAMGGWQPFAGPVWASIEFHLCDRRRVDIDNLSKGILDALNGVVFEDDTQVADLHLTKTIDRDSPHVCVRVGLL